MGIEDGVCLFLLLVNLQLRLFSIVEFGWLWADNCYLNFEIRTMVQYVKAKKSRRLLKLKKNSFFEFGFAEYILYP